MNEEFRRWWAQNHPTERAAVEISETYRAAQDGWRKTPTYHEVRDIIAKHVAAASSPAPASPQQQFVSEVDQWTHDLATAGWIAEAAFNWRAPDGSLWRGPAGAWKELQRRSAPGPEGEQEKCPACGEVNCFDHTLRTTTPPDTPSDGAMRAAKEIADRWFKGDIPERAKLHSTTRRMLLVLAEDVITKHLATTTSPSSETPETETCPVCKNEVPLDSLLSYNNEPNVVCQGCIDAGRF